MGGVVLTHKISLLRCPPRFTTPTSIPSIKSIALLAGTGCSCGFECTCPDCPEHRRPSSSTLVTPRENTGRGTCSDDFAHCVDHLGGVTLPEPDATPRWPSFTSIIEIFFSRVVNLPPPPKNRSVFLDLMNVTVFPSGLFTINPSRSSDGR